MLAQYLPGIGPRRAQALGRLEITTVWDLLWHLPRTWLDRSRLVPLSALRPGCDHTSQVEIEMVVAQPTRGRVSTVEARLRDETASASAVWFNQPYLTRVLKPGARLLLSGTVRSQLGRPQFVHPEFEVLEKAASPEPVTGGRIVPVYDLTAGLSQKMLRTWVLTALRELLPGVEDPLPPGRREALGLAELRWALERIHYPQAPEEAERARLRLAFDEFLTLQLAFGLARRGRQHPHAAAPIAPEGRLLRQLAAALPFRLTRGQREVLSEILRDLRRDQPMNRLLQGDVGSGKTIVAAMAALAAGEAGMQTAYLAPTEILAQQQAQVLSGWFEPLGLRVGVLLGRTRAAERAALLAELKSGAIAVVVGTHALLEGAVEFSRLGLIVVDEQHRFGVLQRARLREKGQWPHCLVMSATPIPRTLSLTLHGDLDVSLLRQMPEGRRPPHTRLVEESRRDALLQWIAERVRAGERAFFVYPLVEESQQVDLRDAVRMHADLSRHPAMSGIGIGLLHGRMKPAEKEAAIAALRGGTHPCLVTTTVVEVGVDVPSATIMVVEHPDRFGLSQLHQLRGRVGRGGGISHMFLMKPPRGEAAERLRVLVREHDGFRVAEEDLRLRGPGDFLGTAQHGLPQLKAGDLTRHGELLLLARREAESILSSDPALSSPAHRLLREQVLLRFGRRMSLAEVG